jgi:uncharacterized repeat protein (TIGR01451 family)
MVKSASPTTVDAAGAVVSYTFHVTNTGNVTFSAIDIDETAFSGTGTHPSATCPAGALAPGASVDCTASYTVTQADMDAGSSITNTAVAAGTGPGGGQTESVPSSATTSITQTPGLTMVKTADPSTVSTAGQLVTYSFAVSNTGNVTLTAVTVADPMPGLSPVTCPSTTLAPATTMTCTATYTTTAADVAAGAITNVATVSAVGPNGEVLPMVEAKMIVRAAPVAPESPITPVTVAVTG